MERIIVRSEWAVIYKITSAAVHLSSCPLCFVVCTEELVLVNQNTNTLRKTAGTLQNFVFLACLNFTIYLKMVLRNWLNWKLQSCFCFFFFPNWFFILCGAKFGQWWLEKKTWLLNRECPQEISPCFINELALATVTMIPLFSHFFIWRFILFSHWRFVYKITQRFY